MSPQPLTADADPDSPLGSPHTHTVLSGEVTMYSPCRELVAEMQDWLTWPKVTWDSCWAWGCVGSLSLREDRQ